MKLFIKNLLPIILFSLIPTLLIWLIFFLRTESFWNIPLPQEGMGIIVANYDGPLYIVVAKSFYNAEIIKSFPLILPVQYYAAHFPLFPLIIRIFAPIFGYPYSMLFATITFSIIAIYYFRLMIAQFVDKKDILWITFVFSIFPARWLIVRSVGSAEPLFIASIIASLYYFKNKKFLASGIWGAIAVLTKSPGILLFLAYFMTSIIPTFKNLAVSKVVKNLEKFDAKKFIPLFFIPISLFAVFAIYKFRLNDFFAYFHSGDNIHLFFPPFQIFNYSQPWVGTFWLEEILFVYLLGFLGLIKLIKMKEYEYAWFTGIFFVSVLFVSHRDLIRYSLPIIPFLFISYSNVINTKEFKYAMLLLIIPIFLYSIAYISQNVMPISDWAHFL